MSKAKRYRCASCGWRGHAGGGPAESGLWTRCACGHLAWPDDKPAMTPPLAFGLAWSGWFTLVGLLLAWMSADSGYHRAACVWVAVTVVNAACLVMLLGWWVLRRRAR